MKTFPRDATIGDLYRPAMQITDPDDAKEYFESLVLWAVTQHGQHRFEAERVQRVNLGYFAGYYDHETRERVERLFNCEHPILDKAEEHQYSPEELIQKGRNRAGALS